MILDNSFRIFMNKMGLIGRVLLYQIIILVLLCGVALACCYPLVTELSNSGYLLEFGRFIEDNLFNFRIDQILEGFAVLTNDFLAIISNNLGLVPFVVMLFVVFVVGGTLLLGLCELPVTECVYGYMGSLARLNFMGYFISNIGRSFKFRLCKLITTFPLDLAIVCAFYGLLQLFFVGGVVSAVAPFIIIFALLLLITIRQSLFAEWSSSVVVNNIGIWQGLKENFKNISKNFKTVFGATAIAVIFAFAINYGLSALTCGVGLLVSIPATILYFRIMYNVIYFHFNGLRYYVDKDRIITSKKVEDTERIQNLRDII